MDKKLAAWLAEINRQLVAEGWPPAEFAPGELEEMIAILSRSDGLVDDGTPEFWGDEDFPVLDEDAEVLAESIGGEDPQAP